MVWLAMVRPYLRGRRRYLLVRWDPDRQVGKGSLIALVKQRLRPLTEELETKPKPGQGQENGQEQGQQQGRNTTVRPGLVRFDPPWAAVVVDHRLQETATRELNNTWQGVELSTIAASGTLEALWRRTGRKAPPRHR